MIVGDFVVLVDDRARVAAFLRVQRPRHEIHVADLYVAAEHGRTMDPSRLRLVVGMHLAETREKAMEQARYGLREQIDYLNNQLLIPSIAAAIFGSFQLHGGEHPDE